jgi:8-oxo-dGTP pyrophosphatase MutT (NUDIX family)
MPFSQETIRVLSLGIVKQDDRILLSQGFDPSKQQNFYRALGGGVNFGETSCEALVREFQEEIQAEITNIKYLGCLENIFIFNDKQGHEIIQIYQCDFVDRRFYQTEVIRFREADREKTALWLDIRQCKSGQLRVVPEQFVEYI